MNRNNINNINEMIINENSNDNDNNNININV